MSHGGGERALAVVATATETEPRQVVSVGMLCLPMALLDCHDCRLALKPPIFRCDAYHVLCSSCREVHGEGEEPCDLTVVPFPYLEAFAATATVPCDFEKYGCDAGRIVYHEAAEHRRACEHAPCGCPARASDGGGCGFTGSLEKLLKHISGNHSCPILVITYGKPRTLNLPVSCRWQVLLGEVDKAAAGINERRNMFLVSLVQEGLNTCVSLLCVTADGGDPAPQFTCELSVDRPGRSTIHTVKTKYTLVSSSLLSGGAPAPVPGDDDWLSVPKEFLSGDTVPLCIYIEKLSPAASTPPPLQALAAPPPCPAADTNKPATTYQSNGKKRKPTGELQ